MGDHVHTWAHFKNLVETHGNEKEDEIEKHMTTFCNQRPLKQCHPPCIATGKIFKRCTFDLYKSDEARRRDIFAHLMQQNMSTLLVFKVLYSAMPTNPAVDDLLKTLWSYNERYNIFSRTANLTGMVYSLFPLSTILVIGPVVEELVYRGVTETAEVLIDKLVDKLLPYLPAKSKAKSLAEIVKFGIGLAMNLLFALMHIVNLESGLIPREDVPFQLFNCLLLGIMLGAYRKKYGLDYAILFHIYNNFTAITGMILAAIFWITRTWTPFPVNKKTKRTIQDILKDMPPDVARLLVETKTPKKSEP